MNRRTWYEPEIWRDMSAHTDREIAKERALLEVETDPESAKFYTESIAQKIRVREYALGNAEYDGEDFLTDFPFMHHKAFMALLKIDELESLPDTPGNRAQLEGWRQVHDCWAYPAWHLYAYTLQDWHDELGTDLRWGGPDCQTS